MAAIEAEQADVASLIEVNNLDYRLAPSLSIATSRSMRVYPATNRDAELGQTFVFVLSTGATYIDLQNSYISFYVRFDNTSALDADKLYGCRMPGYTGYLNLIRSYTIIHASGVELDRMNDATGEWNQRCLFYGMSDAKREIQGSLFNFNNTGLPGSPLKNTTSSFDHAQKGRTLPQYYVGASAAANVRVKPGSGLSGAAGSPDLPGQNYDSWRQKEAWPFADVIPGAANLATNLKSDYLEDEEIKAGTTVRVVLPLHMISPIFANTLLAPSYLMAGLRIELTTYSKEEFFQMVPVTLDPEAATDHTEQSWRTSQSVWVNAPEINVETFTLSDAISRKMAQISASQGLEWAWDAIHQSFSNSNGTNVSIQVARALSRANCVCVMSRTQANLAKTDQGQRANYFASDPWDLVDTYASGGPGAANKKQDGTMNSFQVQLGAQYIPAVAITKTVDFLHSALKTWSQFRRNDEVGGVPLWQFIGTPVAFSANTAATGDRRLPALALACVPLETSSTLQQSGAAISSMRTAVVNMTFQSGRTDDTSTRRIDLFIPYTKLSSHFLDSVTVRS
jgi:hypothetical protein